MCQVLQDQLPGPPQGCAGPPAMRPGAGAQLPALERGRLEGKPYSPSRLKSVVRNIPCLGGLTSKSIGHHLLRALNGLSWSVTSANGTCHLISQGWDRGRLGTSFRSRCLRNSCHQVILRCLRSDGKGKSRR